MNKKAALLITLACALVGVLFFMIQRNWIIVQFTFKPSFQAASTTSIKEALYQKNVRLYYMKNNAWRYEEATIIWNDQNAAQNVRQIVKQWLVVLHDEHILPFSVMLENSAVSSQGSEAYISLSRSLFAPEWSIMQKWLILESLFKTLRYSAPFLQLVSLLVHNKPMDDDHIDLTHPLPLEARL